MGSRCPIIEPMREGVSREEQVHSPCRGSGEDPQKGITTTVAGDYYRKAGKTDGPAQNASFSDDFELAYVPEMCALLISDCGNSVVRQVNLKQEDCVHKSQRGLGGTSVSLIAILCALVGFVIGMVARPFLISRGTLNRRLGMVWKRFQTQLGLMSPTLCSVIRSATVKSCGLYLIVFKTTTSVISYLLLMFSVSGQQNHPPIEPVSLLDSDAVAYRATLPSLDFVDQLKDLISFDGDSSSSQSPSPEEDSGKASQGGNTTTIDAMMMSHISDFDELGCKQRRSQISGPSLVKRQGGVSDLIFG